MSDSPASATPYEVLGVPATADDETLRRAYRQMARQTHPDLGGDPRRFRDVQDAWTRVGTPAARRAYDAGAQPTVPRSSATAAGDRESHQNAYAPRAPSQDSRPRARSYGHPGGKSREVFLAAEREWVGRGDPIADPYDPSLIRTAPRHIRRLLAEALAEEATARIVAELGIAVTVWHDLDAGAHGKLDHVVLTPSGLWAIESIDWGGAVRIEHGEIVGETLNEDEHPVRELVRAARAVQKTTRVAFTGRMLVVPDDAIEEDMERIGSVRRPTAFLVRRSALASVLRSATTPRGNIDVFEVRDRLRQTVRFI